MSAVQDRDEGNIAESARSKTTSATQVQILPDEQLLVKIRATSENDARLLSLCSNSKLAAIQESVVKILRQSIRNDVYVRVSFHKGSLIVLVALTAATALLINTSAFKYVKNDIENIVRKTFDSVSNIKITIDWKKVKKTLGVLGDIISIAAKLIVVFGGSSLTPMPSNLDPDGWTTA